MSQQQATLPFNQLIAQGFDQFKGNEAVLNALKEPGKLPQFTYVWGSHHTGKTHLMVALNADLSDKNKHVLMVHGGQLAEVDLMSIIPQGLQYLLIDDVEMLAGSHASELVLFNLFNHCKAHGIKLVISAEIHTKDSAWQLPDLVSRLNSGLTLGLEPLKGDLALACIEQQFVMNGIRNDEAVMKYLQLHQSSSFPELYQLFMLVSAESLKLKRKITVPLIKQAFKQLHIKDSEV